MFVLLGCTKEGPAEVPFGEEYASVGRSLASSSAKTKYSPQCWLVSLAIIHLSILTMSIFQYMAAFLFSLYGFFLSMAAPLLRTPSKPKHKPRRRQPSVHVHFPEPNLLAPVLPGRSASIWSESSESSTATSSSTGEKSSDMGLMFTEEPTTAEEPESHQPSICDDDQLDPKEEVKESRRRHHHHLGLKCPANIRRKIMKTSHQQTTPEFPSRQRDLSSGRPNRTPWPSPPLDS